MVRRTFDRADELRMALPARRLGDSAIHPSDHDWLVEFAGGERERMVRAILRLREILWDQRGGRVAVVARRHGIMRRLQPRIVVRLHNVAVGTRGGVIRQVRSALCVDEGVTANAHAAPSATGARIARSAVHLRS